MEHTVDGLTFFSNFDSGNLGHVESTEGASNAFTVWVSPDCAGTQFENLNRTWFYFGIRGGFRGREILLHLRNLSPQNKLYEFDMRPVVKVGEDGSWARIETKPKVKCLCSGLGLSWPYTFQSDHPVYFAFTFPYSYTELQGHIAAWERTANSTVSPETGQPRVFFCKETIASSLQGRRVDLLTISGYNGMGTRASTMQGETTLNQPHLRPYSFPEKKIVLLTARVHPGETPSSHTLHGLIDFLMDDKDPRAAALLKHFVFKIIPMLNPDGVYNGFYRTDTRGVNLNRMYDNPCQSLHPTIAATRKVFLSLHATDRLVMYIDFHSHATKRGFFMYGNALQFESQVENLLFPKLISLNSPHFDFAACNFTQKNMKLKSRRDGMSKEGTGRVALFQESKLVHCYTLEVNYNTGASLNIVPLLPGEDPSSIPRDPKAVRYSPPIFHNVGRDIAVSILDYHKINPISRLPLTPFQNLQGCRNWVTRSLKMAMAQNTMRASKGTLSAGKNLTSSLSLPILSVRAERPGEAESSSDEGRPAQRSTSLPATAAGGRGGPGARTKSLSSALTSSSTHPPWRSGRGRGSMGQDDRKGVDEVGLKPSTPDMAARAVTSSRWRGLGRETARRCSDARGE